MIPPVARRFVAGETEAEALEHVRRLNEHGIWGMINRLGTHHDDRQRVRADAAAYRNLTTDIGATDLDGALSVKPSQLGLDLGDDVFFETLESVFDRAADAGVPVWVDMEEHATTDTTLDAVKALAPSYGGIGICLQANLRRTPADLRRIAALPLKLRLVKGGAYDEPWSVAHRDPKRMDRVYRALVADAFETVEGGIAVATHDPAIIEYARALHERHDTPFEIQMLMGVRPAAQRDLAERHDVTQYVPYGSRWKRYVYNRVTENEHTLRFALRALSDSGALR
jgi:proline dehydrogenase